MYEVPRKLVQTSERRFVLETQRAEKIGANFERRFDCEAQRAEKISANLKNDFFQPQKRKFLATIKQN